MTGNASAVANIEFFSGTTKLGEDGTRHSSGGASGGIVLSGFVSDAT